MKQKYCSPELRLMFLPTTDVLTASGGVEEETTDYTKSFKVSWIK